jgi:uncharacterized Tic20 family protein
MTAESLPVAADAATRQFAAIVHLSGVLTFFIGPLLIYLLRESRQDFVGRAASEALNFQLTLLLAWMLTLISLLFIVGFLVLPFLGLVSVGMPVWAAALTSRGEVYRYPVSLRFIGRRC